MFQRCDNSCFYSLNDGTHHREWNGFSIQKQRDKPPRFYKTVTHILSGTVPQSVISSMVIVSRSTQPCNRENCAMHASRLLLGLQKQKKHAPSSHCTNSKIADRWWMRRTDCSELNDSLRTLFSDHQNQSPVPGTTCPQTHRGAPHLPALDPLNAW